MRGDAEQDVLDVVEGADVNELAALDERIEERGTVGALEAAGEEPVLAADRDDAQLILGSVVVDGQPPTTLSPVASRRSSSNEYFADST